MDKIWIAQVIDGADFDRVVAEAAFSSREKAQTWVFAQYEACVTAAPREYKRSFGTHVESFTFIE